MKDAVATMGTILEDDVGGRDAVHVAVISVRAGGRLKPGAHVALDMSFTEPVTNDVDDTTIGIVDPFLDEPVEEGQRFWLYLYPRTITSLRHNWTHPAFEDVAVQYNTPAQKLASERWLKEAIENHDLPPYEYIIGAVMAPDGRYFEKGDDYYGFSLANACWYGGHSCTVPSDFWHHVEIVTGKKLERRPDYFSCSC